MRTTRVKTVWCQSTGDLYVTVMRAGASMVQVDEFRANGGTYEDARRDLVRWGKRMWLGRSVIEDLWRASRAKRSKRVTVGV